MLKLLFTYVLPFVLFATACIISYNYFFGTPEEQEQSRQILAKFTDLGRDVYDLLHSEKEKYDQGKYNDALAMISERIEHLKQLAAMETGNRQQLLDQVNDLQNRASAIQSQINAANNSGNIAPSGTYPPQPYGGNFRTSSNQYNGAPEYMNVGSGNLAGSDLGSQIEALARQTQQFSDTFKKK